MANSGLQDKNDELTDMSASDLLAFVETQHAARLQAERTILRAAYQWARLHPGDSYAAATFGARIQTSPYGAKKLITDAVDIATRLPHLQAGIDAGTVRVRHARHVAEATHDLTGDQAGWVDTEVVDAADGRLAWTRFEALVEGKVAAANPDLAQAKETAAATDRFARMSRVNRHGIATLTIRDHAATILAADAALTFTAKKLEEKMPDTGLNERRLAAFALLINPGTHPDLEVGPVKPNVKIYLHLTPDSPIARMEDHGPVTTAWVRHLIKHVAGKVRVAPVIDLAGLAPVDAYEIPARLREAVHLIHPGDVFPYAANTSRRVDLDHHIPYAEGGATAVGNLGPLTRTHHRIKTHGHWEVRQPFPGITIWRDPQGAHYLVDPTGTRRITAVPDDDLPGRVDVWTRQGQLHERVTDVICRRSRPKRPPRHDR